MERGSGVYYRPQVLGRHNLVYVNGFRHVMRIVPRQYGSKTDVQRWMAHKLANIPHLLMGLVRSADDCVGFNSVHH
jgi:hypothetical protein